MLILVSLILLATQEAEHRQAKKQNTARGRDFPSVRSSRL